MLRICSLGHSCFTLTDGNSTIIFDPFLAGNPDASVQPDEVKVDYVLPSHGHGDHLGDAISIAARCSAPIVGVYELCMYCARHGAEVIPMHIGGARQFPFGSVKLVPALHGSAVVGDDSIEYTGLACGFVVEMGEATVYFAGDTALFGDMELIGSRHPIDVAILPVGDNFTMGIEDAAFATQMLQPEIVIPMHYNAFEPIRQDPAEFARLVTGDGVQCEILRPGDELELDVAAD